MDNTNTGTEGARLHRLLVGELAAFAVRRSVAAAIDNLFAVRFDARGFQSSEPSVTQR